MTEAITFDTHKFVKNLTEHGFTEQQAEVLADEQVNLLNSNLATKTDIATIHAGIEKLRLATKTDIATIHADIEQLKQATKADIEQLRLATKTDIAELESRLLRWMIGAMIAQAGLIVALIKLI